MNKHHPNVFLSLCSHLPDPAAVAKYYEAKANEYVQLLAAYEKEHGLPKPRYKLIETRIREAQASQLLLFTGSHAVPPNSMHFMTCFVWDDSPEGFEFWNETNRVLTWIKDIPKLGMSFIDLPPYPDAGKNT